MNTASTCRAAFIRHMATVVLVAFVVPAEAGSWRAVVGRDAGVVVPGLPAGTRTYYDVGLADIGGGLAGLRMSGATGGYWAYRSGAWAQYMRTGVTGALGPGRTGGESGDVFIDYLSEGGQAGPDGQRAFVGRAGDANDPNNWTRGVWRWNGVANIEVARLLTDGVLGPGLGSGWVWPDLSSLEFLPFGAGEVLVNANVESPGGVPNRLLVKAAPGGGNQPCILRNSVDPALSPGLSAGDSFNVSWSLDDLAVTSTGHVYGSLAASSGYGIWQVCDGAPRAIAASGVSGSLAPDIGEATATFSGSFGTPRPGVEGQLYFSARFRHNPSDSTRTALFWNDGTGNRPLAMTESSGFYGPHWDGSTWYSFDTSSLMSAGEWVAFIATVTTTDGGHPSGLWRVQAGQPPELVALLDLTGAYGPEPNRKWSSFQAYAVLSNGALLVSARTDPENERALWLLERGQVPRRVLVEGDVASIPTSAGTVTDTITDFSIGFSGPALYSGGNDSWVGADGSVLVSADTASHGSVYILGTPLNPIDHIFSDGFDD